MQFKDVLVDDGLKQQLINLVRENRISHAQLFLGAAGTQTFALAVAYAQYISCQNRSDHDSCGVCPSCMKFAKLSHPDLHIYFPNCITKKVKKEPDSSQFMAEFREFVEENRWHIGLNGWLEQLGGENKQATINIRDCAHIISKNSTQSYEGGYKVYILWMVERLYYAAAPKLLKTLEEPENKSLFILIAESPDNILSTILSRTQLVKIPPLSAQVIENQLVKDFRIDQEKAHDIAELSEGNYIKAMELFHDSSEQREMMGQFDFLMKSIIGYRNGNLEAMRFGELQEMFATIIGGGREAQKNFARYVIRMFRNMLLMNTNNADIVRGTNAEKNLINEMKSLVTLKNISPLLEECDKLVFHIERNGNANLLFTDFYLKIGDILAGK